MNVLYPPRVLENRVLEEWLECVFRPCYRYKKHTKLPPWPIDLNLCSASCLRVTAGLPLRPPYTPAAFIAFTHIPGLWFSVYKQTCEYL